MRIDKITVRNFRNLAEIEVPLEAGTVIVGENRVGKSNFIHALRLVLDPTLPNSERYLHREDFWEGLSDGTSGWDPMVAGEEIEVSVDFSDFEDEAEALTALSDALIEGDPMVARLTYRYSPRADGGNGSRPVYAWRIFGGDREGSSVPTDLRRYIWVAYLQALRDAGRLGKLEPLAVARAAPGRSGGRFRRGAGRGGGRSPRHRRRSPTSNRSRNWRRRSRTGRPRWSASTTRWRLSWGLPRSNRCGSSAASASSSTAKRAGRSAARASARSTSSTWRCSNSGWSSA